MASRKFLVPILLPADPTAALEAATKQYVDTKAGGATPDVNKAYVDATNSYVIEKGVGRYYLTSDAVEKAEAILSQAVGWWDAGEQQACGWMPNKGTGAAALDLWGGPTTVPRSRIEGGAAVLPGQSSSAIVAADPVAGGQAFTDLEIVVRLKVTTFATQKSLVTKSTTVVSSFLSWRLDIGTTAKTPSFIVGSGSPTISATAALPYNNGDTFWFKMTHQANTGSSQYATNFYYANDQATEPTVWTLLGVVRTGATFALPTTQAAYALGAYNWGTSQFLDGAFYEAIIRTGLGGTEVAHFRVGDLDSRTFIGTDSTGKVWRLRDAVSRPKVHPFIGERYVWLGGTNNVLTAPTVNTTMDVDGTYEIIVRAAAPNWDNNGAFAYKMTDAGGPNNVMFGLAMASGKLRANWRTSALAFKNIDSSVPAPLTYGVTYWLRLTLDPDDGAGNSITNYYWAPDQPTEPTVWNQVGTTVTTAGAASIAMGSGPFRVGGASIAYDEDVYEVIMRRDGILGMRWRAADMGQTGGVSITGETWTVSGRDPTGAVLAVVDRPSMSCANGLYYSLTAANALLDFAANQDFTVMVATRGFPLPASTTPASQTAGVIVAKQTNSTFGGETQGWGLTSTDTDRRYRVNGTDVDGTGKVTADTGTNPTVSDGAVQAVAMRRQGVTMSLRTPLTAVAATVAGATSRDLTNAANLRVGSGITASQFSSGEYFGLAIWRRALTDAEVDAVRVYLESGQRRVAYADANAIRVFTSAAARDAWAAPNGSLAVVVAENQVYRRIAGAWSDPTPRGLVAWRQGYKTSLAVTATPQELYKVTATLIAGRAYRWSFSIRAAGATSLNSMRLQGTATPTLPGSVIDQYLTLPTTSYNAFTHVGRLLPSVTQAYTITVNVSSAATSPVVWTDGEGCVFMIEDVGLQVADVPG